MSKTTEPTPQEPLGDSEGTATSVVVGLEPVAEYDDHDAELYWRKDFNIPKGITKLYSAVDVAKLQVENEVLRKDVEWWRFFHITN